MAGWSVEKLDRIAETLIALSPSIQPFSQVARLAR
jgi:hypothetical protein